MTKANLVLLLLSLLLTFCCGCVPKVPDIDTAAIKQVVAEAIHEEAQRFYQGGINSAPNNPTD